MTSSHAETRFLRQPNLAPETRVTVLMINNLVQDSWSSLIFIHLLQMTAIYCLRPLNPPPGFKREAGCIHAESWAAAAESCNVLNWLIDKMIA